MHLMELKSLCKSIESRVSKELVLARSPEEKALVLTSALYDFGHSVLRHLELPAEGGSRSNESLQSQAAVTELLTFLALPFISNCSSYKQGITVFDDLGELCSNESLRARLVIYSNQLKRRWLKADSSALPINPRAARSKVSGAQKKTGSGFLLGLVWIVLVLLAYLFLWPSLNPSIKSAQVRQTIISEPATPETPTASPQGAVDTEQPKSVTGQEFFSYTDKKGVLHLGNNPGPVSQQVQQLPTQKVEQPVVPVQPRQVSLPAPQPPPQNVSTPAHPAEPAKIAAMAQQAVEKAKSGMNVFESCRCNSGLATKGDLAKDVLEKCGQPFQQVYSRGDCRQIWLYNFGPNEFMQGVCFPYPSGPVTKVLSLDYGF